ncbi:MULTISPECIES: hypothetical protein [unclassified Sphingomonas]|nr:MULTISPECIES: hypothetical protein [unclassified Sphingomonas]
MRLAFEDAMLAIGVPEDVVYGAALNHMNGLARTATWKGTRTA